MRKREVNVPPIKFDTVSCTRISPVPSIIDEPYLIKIVNDLRRAVLPETNEITPSSDILGAMNTLFSFRKMSIRVEPGCGAGFIRDSLAILVEEHNKNAI